MFGLLNSSQIYGFQQTHEKNISPNQPTKPNTTQKQRRSSSNASDTSKENKFLATLSSAATQGMKSPTNFIEKFIKSELLSGYDTIKNYKNSYQSTNKTPGSPSVVSNFSCLHGSYRSSVEGEFYEAINVKADYEQQNSKKSDMTIKCTAVGSQQQQQQGYQKLSDSELDLPPSLLNSSGASSGEFNSSDSTSTTTTHTTTATNYNNLFRKMQNGSVKVLKNLEVISGNGNEITSDNSSSSISTTTNSSSTSSSHHTSNKSNDLQRTSSSASSGIRERKKSNSTMVMTHRSSPEVASSISDAVAKSTVGPSSTNTTGGGAPPSERSQRRKLIHMISNYDQQNKLLQLELAKEKRRRNEELTCVVKSLLCFESKLKSDMKSVNQRLLEKDAEICRLVRQNRALRKQLQKVREVEGENLKDEGVEEDDELMDAATEHNAMDDVEDCLVLEALQCNNCRKQFYDIDLKESWTQTGKDGSRNNDDHTTELGSSSDDTVSSSFYGARRSVRYTSKRTSGTFRDYMRSRSMNIDDDDDCPSQLENNSEENTSSISRNDSHRSYEKMNIYSRTIERMHGVKGGSERGGGQELRSVSRASNKSCSSKSSCSSSSKSSSSKSATQVEEDDGIFSPTQDEDYEEEEEDEENYKVTKHRSMEFSEASPKQVYETSTDDWYASASDQEDTSTAPKTYAQNAVNPVLECVNQILLQQSMEEPMPDDDDETKPILRKSNELSSSDILTLSGTPKTPTSQAPNNAATSSLPRRSSLSGRRSSRSDSYSSDGQPSRSGTLTRKRVHFSTKNSMVHVPRNEDMEHEDEDEQDVDMHADDCSLLPGTPTTLPPTLAHYHPMNYFATQLKPQSPQSMQSTGLTTHSATPPTVIYATSPRNEHLERLDTLNYESIYSNEYEPIGSEHNSSNLYVDMESTAKQSESRADAKQLQHKMPPALPPKPANLLKFKKSLQQLDEMPDEHLTEQDDCAVSTTTASEPDYCSILEVNMGGMRSVQIKADVHKAPESEPDLEQTANAAAELERQVSGSVRSDDTCAETHKTDEIEEIFADIPKLPNVAAIIAPKHSPKYRPEIGTANDHYLLMSPKVDSTASKKLALSLNTSDNDYLLSTTRSMKSPKVDTSGLTLQLGTEAAARQYKRKHVPNILAEINKRMYNTPVPNSPSTPTKPSLPSPTAKKPSTLLHSPITPQRLPLLQAEFDWYNLDAEYGKATPHHHHSGSAASSSHTPDILKGSDNLGIAGSLLEEIHEDHESVVATADEYNLDEEFSLTCERPDLVLSEEPEAVTTLLELPKMSTSLSVICEAVNFPLFSESSPQPPTAKAQAKKMKKNLANFEKFIEGSGLSTKTLPSKRKIYFAGPFV